MSSHERPRAINWIASRWALSAAVLVCSGCASNFGGAALEAPRAPEDSILAQAGLGWEAEAQAPVLRGRDAEGHLARGYRPGHRLAPALPRPPGQGFDQGAPADLGRLLAWRPDLPVPGRLAVVEARGRREFHHAPAWGTVEVVTEPSGWSVRPPERGPLNALRTRLQASSAGAQGGDAWPAAQGAPRQLPFAQIDALPGLFLPQHADLGSVRYAAARVGADAVLIYAASTRVYSFRNGLANLYPTLVGLLLPGDETVVVSRLEAAIVSVASGYVFCVAQGEGRREESRPPWAEERYRNRELIEQAEHEACWELGLRLSEALASLEANGRFAGPQREGAK